MLTEITLVLGVFSGVLQSLISMNDFELDITQNQCFPGDGKNHKIRKVGELERLT